MTIFASGLHKKRYMKRILLQILLALCFVPSQAQKASSKKNALEIADLSRKMEEIEKKIKEKEADLAGEQSIYDSLLFQHEKACEELNSLAGEKKDQYRPELLSQKKAGCTGRCDRQLHGGRQKGHRKIKDS